MNYKKKIICLLALFTIVVVNVLNVVVKSDDAETLTLSGIEAVAATYETSPGNYTEPIINIVQVQKCYRMCFGS